MQTTIKGLYMKYNILGYEEVFNKNINFERLKQIVKFIEELNVKQYLILHAHLCVCISKCVCMCMWECVCMYVYVYVCTCIYVCMCMCVYACMYVCMCTYVSMCVYVCVYVCMCVYSYIRDRQPNPFKSSIR